MFARDEVNALFNDASRALQRSQLLLEERSRGAPLERPSVMPNSPSFEAALRALRELMEFAAFLDASEKVGERLLEESRQPSPAMAKKRRNGSRCPLLRRVVDGLAGVQGMWAGDNRAAEGLWSGGALLASHLVLAGLFADWQHGAPRAAQQRIALLQQMIELDGVPQLEECRKDDLLQLLSEVKAGMPGEVVDELDAQIMRVACSLTGEWNMPSTPAQLSSLLLFPTVIPFIVQNASTSLAVDYIITPLERAATGLLPMYLSESPAEFVQACRQLVQHVMLVGMYAAVGLKLSTVGGVQRVVTFTKRLFDALLMPVEGAFTAALPRAGMTVDVHQGLAGPLCHWVRSWAKQVEGKRGAETTAAASGARKLLPVWCTASFRALMVVEALAHAELGVVSGRGNATAQQKKYYSMLQQSNGRVTTAILSAVTEDRQLLFEETTTRSAQGHKVYRIHEGGTGPTVYVYLDHGIVYMKVGRERLFRRAKSVEDVFSVLADSSQL
ncbi:hypothetical protein TraAM80_01267 [Trypanosoma rangeli]|uniref:Uncharacterized protein n=1 Tax=Trypanosoma rangeli TaxID=5698 RepID=A0A3R7NSE1_TRYRA|nr:uncharacterized protein TraAM80_01267 [Trypanosoma rangeli]RNF10883.1 hypothetical protein TraAM80_01267 [Trypanosoma rangeli]|eukprot:RNF10883.1 hypothetical protein TraAM80_01267 [Trypanosoma rangeli]